MDISFPFLVQNLLLYLWHDPTAFWWASFHLLSYQRPGFTYGASLEPASLLLPLILLLLLSLSKSSILLLSFVLLAFFLSLVFSFLFYSPLFLLTSFLLLPSAPSSSAFAIPNFPALISTAFHTPPDILSSLPP